MSPFFGHPDQRWLEAGQCFGMVFAGLKGIAVDAVESSTTIAACRAGMAAANDAVSRWCSPIVEYPTPRLLEPGRGVVLDEECYRPNFCVTCCEGGRLALLSRPIPGGYCCTVSLLRRCADCSCELDAHVQLCELEDVDVYLPPKLYHSLSHMRQAKDGFPKRNLHVGWGALVEHAEVDEYHDAILHVLPEITRLQNWPARQVPWVVSTFFPTSLHGFFRGPALARAAWATRWYSVPGNAEPEGEGERVHNQTAMLEVKVEEHGGLAARVSFTPPDAVTALALTGREPSQEVGDTGLVPGDPRLPQSVDGRHAVDVDQCAERIGPVIGNACYYATRRQSGEANALGCMARRIGDGKAKARKFTYDPSPADKALMNQCVNLLKKEWFTKERVQAKVIEMGQLHEMLAGKLAESRVRTMVDELLAGHEISESVEAMVKGEITSKASKAPRLVMDRGLHRFLIASYASKVVEELLTELDIHCNIKHKAKAERMDDMSAYLSAECVWAAPKDGGLGAEFSQDEMVLFENDFSTYEFTQTLEFVSEPEGKRYGWRLNGTEDESDKGLLFIERALLDHICTLIGEVMCELYPFQERVLIGKLLKIELKPKVGPTPEAFLKPNWRLVMWMRMRLSGDTQTSWGNRVNQTIPLSIAILGSQAVAFWARLMDFCAGRLNPNLASSWIFTKSRKRIYWRPHGEGDDQLSQVHTKEKPGSSAEDSPLLMRVAKKLESFGLTHNLVLVKDGGRAEFVGCHFLVKAGCLVPRCWVPDMARGIISASYTTSKALGNADTATRARTALSFFSRAVMYKGRSEPMYVYYYQLSQEWLARAGPGSGDTAVTMDWTLAQLVGDELGTVSKVGELMRKFDSFPSAELGRDAQIRLAEASLQGSISFAEFGNWSTMAVRIDSPSEEVLSVLPRCFRAKLQACE